MEFLGRYVIPSKVDKVWAALNDPDILRQCIPGCEHLELIDPSHLIAVVVLRIGPVKATFRANIEITEADPPFHCVLKGEGQGGVAGFARGSATVTLLSTGDMTVLDYRAQAVIGGKLAQLGQRLIDSAAKQLTEDFFGRFAALLGVPELGQATASSSVPLVVLARSRPVFLPVPTRNSFIHLAWLAGAMLIFATCLITYRLLSTN